MNQMIEMNIEDKVSVLNTYRILIALNEKMPKAGSIILKIHYNDFDSITKTIEVYMGYQSLYVWGVGNSTNNLENNHPFVLENPSYQNSRMYPLPGVMKKEAIVGLLNKIYEAKEINDILKSKTSGKYKNDIIALIYIVSEAVRSELCKKVAMDILFDNSSISYVMGANISNWAYSQYFLENWNSILEKYARNNYKNPIAIYHIASYCIDLLKDNPSLGKLVCRNAIRLGVPLPPDII